MFLTVSVEEEKYEYPASKHDTNYQDDNTLKDTQFDVKELPPADVNTETEASNNKKQETKNDTDQPDSNSPHPPQPHVQQQQQHHHQHKVTGMNKDGVVFICKYGHVLHIGPVMQNNLRKLRLFS